MPSHQSVMTLIYPNTSMRRRPWRHNTSSKPQLCDKRYTLLAKKTSARAQKLLVHAYKAGPLNTSTVKTGRGNQARPARKDVFQHKLHPHIKLPFQKRPNVYALIFPHMGCTYSTTYIIQQLTSLFATDHTAIAVAWTTEPHRLGNITATARAPNWSHALSASLA